MATSPSVASLQGEVPLAHRAHEVGPQLRRHDGARVHESQRFVLQHLVDALGVELGGDAPLGILHQHGPEAREELAERPVVAVAHCRDEPLIIQRPHPPLVPASLPHTHSCRPRTPLNVRGGA